MIAAHTVTHTESRFRFSQALDIVKIIVNNRERYFERISNFLSNNLNCQWNGYPNLAPLNYSIVIT